MADALPRPRAAVVYNPTKVDVRRLRALVEATEAEKNWGPTLWAATTLEDAGEGQALRLLKAAPNVVIAVGGDGTVSAVAQAMRHQPVPLGIVPTGTTNLFARALGLPLVSTRKALRAAFDGAEPSTAAVASVDVGRVDVTLDTGEIVQRAFLVMAGMGVDAQMVVNTPERGKSILGWAGYVAAIVSSLTQNNQFELAYALGGGAVARGSAHTLVIGNAGVLPAGIRMIPGASIDDGLLDVVLLRPRGVRGWSATVGWFLRTNSSYLPRRADARAKALGTAPVVSTFVRHARTESVSLSVAVPQDFEVDGEYIGKARSVEAFIEPAALRVSGSYALSERGVQPLVSAPVPG